MVRPSVHILFWVALSWLPNCRAQTNSATNAFHQWWRDRPYSRSYNGTKSNTLPLIHVEGNHFADSTGRTVRFRGLSISDPDKLEHQGHWNQAHFEKVKEMGATLVRIPVHPRAWRERTPSGYLKMLDQAVDWCTDLEMHVIIDWHTIGNLRMELFQDPMYDTTQKETFEFWRTMSQHFRGTTTVAFYELFNEPTVYRGQLGSMSWSEWKRLNEDMIQLIRAFDTNKIPLVAGLDWAYDLTPLNNEPIAAEGIGYTVHPYANKRTKPWEPKWEVDFGFAANRFPVVATEFGFSTRRRSADEEDYGPLIVSYLESKNIIWVAWCFDPEWGPTMLASWKYDLTPSGEFFKQAMQPKKAE